MVYAGFISDLLLFISMSFTAIVVVFGQELLVYSLVCAELSAARVPPNVMS
jgi:hypothetical protein